MPGRTGRKPGRIWPGLPPPYGSNASADLTSCLAGVAERFGLSDAAAPSAAAAAHTGGTSTATFDINAMLSAKAAAAGENLDWKPLGGRIC